jgi:hypothetical protein
MWDYGWTKLALWNIAPCCRFNFARGALVSWCAYMMACRPYHVCHLQGQWVNWNCVLLEHWNVLYNCSARVYAPVVIMTLVSTTLLPSSSSTLAICSVTCHCCSCSSLTFLFVISLGLRLSMALKYLPIMENFISVYPGAFVNFTCDFDNNPDTSCD